jgi:hypothetical protein
MHEAEHAQHRAVLDRCCNSYADYPLPASHREHVRRLSLYANEYEMHTLGCVRCSRVRRMVLLGRFKTEWSTTAHIPYA